MLNCARLVDRGCDVAMTLQWGFDVAMKLQWGFVHCAIRLQQSKTPELGMLHCNQIIDLFQLEFHNRSNNNNNNNNTKLR
jgi:hypothetical protein